jgi:hypothetical protein
MKKIHLVPYCILLTVWNCILPSQLGQVAWVMRRLFGGKAVPSATEFALAMPVWFYIFTALTIVASVCCFIRRVPMSVLVHWLLVACILEGVALFYFAWGICLPFNSIMLSAR